MDEKKEKVLHTRVPESLDDELRRRASRLGTSVSTLVRNVLSHAFGLVEDVIVDSADVARSARGEGSDPPRPAGAPAGSPARPQASTAPPRILGWQPLILNLNAVCAECNAILPRGSDGGLAVTERPMSPPHIVCSPCLESLRHEPAPDDAPATPDGSPEP